MVILSYSVACTLHYIIFIITQTYLQVLDFLNACQVYFLECVSKIKFILSIIFHAIYGAVYFQQAHSSCDDCDNKCILS